MAIQVNGTEVISNSRALNNITSVDATTAAAVGAAGVGGFAEAIFNRPTSGTSLLTTLIPPGFRNPATSSTAPTSSDGLIASWTLTSTKVLAALTIKSDMTKITWNRYNGLWSGGAFLWLYNPELPSGAQYVNVLGQGQAIFNVDLAGGDTPPSPANYLSGKSLSVYGANSVLYLLCGRTYDNYYGGVECAANFLTVDSYASPLS